MKRLIITLSILLAISYPTWAQTAFDEANAQYAEGNYQEATALYEQCLTSEEGTMLTPKSMAQVYYNLGNAQFKQGELAQSILSYERALRLNPRDKDAKHNLKFAQSRIIDNIEDNQAFFVSNWLRAIRNSLDESTWTGMSIGLFALMLIGFLLFALGRQTEVRKSAFYIAIVALVISICSMANAGSLHHRDNARQEAIITQGIVNAKSSPDRSGTDLFTLHEGTKVTIHETIGEWCNIHVGNNIGWIRISCVERI